MAASNANSLTEAELLTLLEWDPEKYGIGVRSIDEQHKILIALTNELTRLYAVKAHPSLALGGVRTGNVDGAPSPKAATPQSKGTSTILGRLAKAAVQQQQQNGVPASSSGHIPAATCSLSSFSKYPVVGHRQFDPDLQSGSETAKIVEDLVTYTCKYLLVEDHLLETYAYVDRAMQQQDHELFTCEVSYCFRLIEEYSCQISDIRRLLLFLRLWLSGHIPRDRKYAPMLIEKGVGA